MTNKTNNNNNITYFKHCLEHPSTTANSPQGEGQE